MAIQMEDMDKKGSDFQEGPTTFDAYSGKNMKQIKRNKKNVIKNQLQ